MAKTLQRVAIAAGGTAGHINPALALAEVLSKQGVTCVFFGQATRLEKTLVPEAGFEFVPLDLSGFDRSRPWTLITALYKMKMAEKQVAAYVREHGSFDVAVGFGAYIELPLVNYAAKHNIPVVLHEQNSVPGLANRKSATKAKTVCLAFEGAQNYFTSAHTVMTGNPVREAVSSAQKDEARKKLNIEADAQVLLVFGGSLGAHTINESMAALKPQFKARKNLYVFHSTGQKDFAAIEALLDLSEEEKKHYKLLSYISNMGEMLGAADLVVSRSGASSVAEIEALAKPSILVPYPHATADHQTTNAKHLSEPGAAVLLPDDEVDAKSLGNLIFSLLDDPTKLETMSTIAQSLSAKKASELLADEVYRALSL